MLLLLLVSLLFILDLTMETIKIGKNDQNLRLDNFLLKVYPQSKKSFIFKMIRKGYAKVNDIKKPFNYHLALNDVISIKFKIEKQLTIPNQWKQVNKAIKIVYEDDNLLVVNKQPHLIVDDYSHKNVDSLINRVKNYLFTTKQWDPSKENQFEPCLLHRLDTNTSGLIMIAKNHEIANFLNDKIKKHEIDKYYHCLVYGKLPFKNKLLSAYWFKDAKKNIVKISAVKQNKSFVPIQTQCKVLSYDVKNNLSNLEVKLITGKTHQIRAHLNFIGHPLVGEQKYTNKKYKNLNRKDKFQQLIAYKIVFNFKDPKNPNFDYLNNKIIRL